jgi:hypothetical protein
MEPDLQPSASGSATTAALTLGPAAATGAPVHQGWIHSPAFDLALFTLSPLAGLVVLWANFSLPGGTMVVVAATYLIAIPHYLSSLTFFLGDDNLAYYRTRRLAFFAGPVVIILAVAALHALKFHRPVQVAMFVWNVWHVALQSFGISSIYRQLNDGSPSERIPARLAILFVNATMAFWFVDRFPPLYQTLAAVSPAVPWMLRALCLPIGAGALSVLLWRLAHRARSVSLPEGAFLASSLLLFHPYLWVQDSNLATFGMLMGHFIQYLAIVWLLNHRKYAHAQGSARQQWLGRVSAEPTLIFAVIVAMGTTFYAANRFTAMVGAPMTYIIAWNALTLVHFYIDGLVWTFRNPFVRQTVGPYLMPAARVAR